MHRLALSIAAVALVLSSVACAAPSEEEDTTTQAQAQTATGFVCNENGCSCDDDSPNPDDSCAGMTKVCEALGLPPLAWPDGGFYCRFNKAGSVSAPLPAPPKRPIVRSGTKAGRLP